MNPTTIEATVLDMIRIGPSEGEEDSVGARAEGCGRGPTVTRPASESLRAASSARGASFPSRAIPTIPTRSPAAPTRPSVPPIPPPAPRAILEPPPPGGTIPGRIADAAEKVAVGMLCDHDDDD